MSDRFPPGGSEPRPIYGSHGQIIGYGSVYESARVYGDARVSGDAWVTFADHDDHEENPR